MIFSNFIINFLSDLFLKLLKSLRPRLVLSGHTHYSCNLTHHIEVDANYQVTEWSVASFSPRNLLHPSFIMVCFDM